MMWSNYVELTTVLIFPPIATIDKSRSLQKKPDHNKQIPFSLAGIISMNMTIFSFNIALKTDVRGKTQHQ